MCYRKAEKGEGLQSLKICNRILLFFGGCSFLVQAAYRTVPSSVIVDVSTGISRCCVGLVADLQAAIMLKIDEDFNAGARSGLLFTIM